MHARANLSIWPGKDFHICLQNDSFPARDYLCSMKSLPKPMEFHTRHYNRMKSVNAAPGAIALSAKKRLIPFAPCWERWRLMWPWYWVPEEAFILAAASFQNWGNILFRHLSVPDLKKRDVSALTLQTSRPG